MRRCPWGYVRHARIFTKGDDVAPDLCSPRGYDLRCGRVIRAVRDHLPEPNLLYFAHPESCRGLETRLRISHGGAAMYAHIPHSSFSGLAAAAAPRPGTRSSGALAATRAWAPMPSAGTSAQG